MTEETQRQRIIFYSPKSSFGLGVKSVEQPCCFLSRRLPFSHKILSLSFCSPITCFATLALSSLYIAKSVTFLFPPVSSVWSGLRDSSLNPAWKGIGPFAMHQFWKPPVFFFVFPPPQWGFACLCDHGSIFMRESAISGNIVSWGLALLKWIMFWHTIYLF